MHKIPKNIPCNFGGKRASFEKVMMFYPASTSWIRLGVVSYV